MGIGGEFQEKTKYIRGKIPEGFYGGGAVKPFKTYPDAPVVGLSRPAESGGMGLWEALRKRRSRRSYGGAPLTSGELSQLLWAACGASERIGGFLFRTAPSAGALFPIETYVAVRVVAGLEGGLYHYNVADHTLEELRKGDISREVTKAALGQRMVETADAVFFFSAVFDRSAVKYLERAYRYVYLDTGHIAQNLFLAATALGIGACPIGALFDDEINNVLGVDGRGEGILYMASVGREP